MKKATHNPMGDTPVLDARLCLFCPRKELAIIGVTGMNYPMGEKCFKKAIKRDVDWEEGMSFKTLKQLLRRQQNG